MIGLTCDISHCFVYIFFPYSLKGGLITLVWDQYEGNELLESGYELNDFVIAQTTK